MLFEALTPEAQNELVRDHVIELVTVVVRAVPNLTGRTTGSQ